MLFTEGSLELRGAPICRRLVRSQRRAARADGSTACLRHTDSPPVTLGPGPAPRPPARGHYAAGMPEHSLDGLVNQFAVVLTAMTESESLLRDQIRRVRLGAQAHPSVADVAPSPVPSFPTEARPSPADSVIRVPDPVPASSGDDHTEQVAATTPAWASAAPTLANRPEFSETEPASPVTGHRNYDYFSELDEKLTGLRQRYLE